MPVLTVDCVFPNEHGKEFTEQITTVTREPVAPLPVRVMSGLAAVALESWLPVIVRPVTAKLCWTWGAAL